MHSSRKLLTGTAVLTSGRVAGYALSFARNIILARALAKADFALAAVFSMAMILLELSGNMAFGTQIIQSKHGNEERFQATAHTLQFSGGSISALLLILISVPIAHLFGVPHTWWAFALLAMVPLCQGLSHSDVARCQRELNYRPLILVDVVPQALITAAAWPLAVWLGDYRVIVILMIAKAVTGTILSHALAQRRYRWAWDREYVRGMLTFGWPLLLTGFVIFGSQQLDQMLVGAVFSLNALANYALAASLVSIPWYIYSQVAGSVMLPVMARAQDDLERFRRQYRRCAQTAAVAGIIPALTLIIVGEQLITLLYGAKYQGSGVFVALLGTASALRFLRFAPTVASSAKGDTINHLYSNLWRISSLPLALLVVALNGTPVQIAGCAIVGELLAVTAAMVRLSRNGVPLRESLGGGIYLVTTLAVGVALSFACASWSIYAVAGLAAGCLVVALGVAWLMFPEIVSFVSGALKRTPDPSLATR